MVVPELHRLGAGPVTAAGAGPSAGRDGVAAGARAGQSQVTVPAPELAPELPAVVLDVEIPSDIAAIEQVVDLVVARCRALKLPGRACTLNVPVALSEALSNAVVRGNREDPSKRVRVRALVSDREFVLEVTDEGPGFDLAAAMRDPRYPGALEREDGRGIFLMQQLMDRVEQFQPRGNGVRLVLRR